MNHLLSHAAHYLAVVAVCLAAVRPLAAGQWTWRVPRASILLWQLLGFSLGSSLVGLCLAVGLAPYRSGELRALTRLVAGVRPPELTTAHLAAVGAGFGLAVAMLAVLAWQVLAVARARRRHRSLLSLVADPDPADPGLLLVDHPAAVAYCLPGRRRAVVITAGAVGRLGRDQLAAVLEHERAHATERHDLVLLPFAALRRALRRSRLAARAYAAVSLLVEMRADDLALRRHSTECLAGALRVVSGSGGAAVPEGALAAADDQVGARLHRLAGRRAGRGQQFATAAMLAVAVAVAATPVSLFLFP